MDLLNVVLSDIILLVYCSLYRLIDCVHLRSPYCILTRMSTSINRVLVGKFDTTSIFWEKSHTNKIPQL